MRAYICLSNVTHCLFLGRIKVSIASSCQPKKLGSISSHDNVSSKGQLSKSEAIIGHYPLIILYPRDDHM